MRKLLLFIIFIASTATLRAAPGDTTWVQAHSDKWLDWYNNYDTTVTFPDGSVSYRKIIMVFTLGKYSCPGSPQYCSDWDYTVQTKIMTPAGDTLELGRLITPYANSARMTASWRGVYNFDVTDYYHQLKNAATVRVHYSGYSGGFTANVRFAFIEGTPPRNVIGITSVWKNSYDYGHGSVAINDALADVALTAPPGTVSAESKVTITGHGGDAQNCAEFCPNSYTMNLNNTPIVTQNFWRDDCGANNYYPQNGTWIYNRAGWCPGDLVHGYSHELTGVTANSNYNLNVTFPAYTSIPSGSGSKASYIIESSVIYYAGFNKTLDASLDDIIAPSNSEAHFRSNPLTGKPMVRITNTGSTTITSVTIQYSATPQFMPSYTWTGTLLPLKDTVVTLPEPWGLRSATGSANTFTAKIIDVNGQPDNDLTNNILTSNYTAAPVWPVTFRVLLKTNKNASQNSWQIIDDNNTVVYQRTGAHPDSVYIDTVVLGPAPYRLVVKDEGCDGLNWWANPAAGAGFVQARTMSNGLLTMKGYYNGDFGCGFTQSFHTDWPTNIPSVLSGENSPSMEAYPNPAGHSVTISLSGIKNFSGQLSIIDALGRVVLSKPCTTSTEQMSITSLSNGIYTIIYSDNTVKLQTRLLIAK